MKFTNAIKLISLMLLVSRFINAADPEFASLHQQARAFPDAYNSPTNSTNLSGADYSAPLMSGALSEQDPKRKLRFIDFIGDFRFTAYRLTRGESELIYQFSDANRDSLLDHSEWDNFVTLYVLPFEACDKNKDYLLDAAEFEECYSKDPKSANIIFQRRKSIKSILHVMSNRSATLINFYEYLFVRRAMYAWRSCQSNVKFIAKSHFRCALKTAINFEKRQNYKMSDDQIYETGLRIDNDFNVQLDFISYLRILNYFHIFNVWSAGNSIAQLEKAQLIKAVHEDRLPNNLEESEVETWYDLISANPFRKAESMGFPTFVFFYNLHRLFNKYSVERPHQLTLDEAKKLFNDMEAPARSLHAVDRSITNFSEAEYQEASLVLNRLRVNENQFFTSFVESNESKKNLKKAGNKNTNHATSLLAESLTSGLLQDASANTAAIWNQKALNATYIELKFNKENREVFFTTFCEPTRMWSKTGIYRAFSLANLFNFLDKSISFKIHSSQFVNQLMTSYELTTPAINIEQRQNYGVYKSLSKDVSLDMLTFLAIENYRYKLGKGNKIVTETAIKMLLQDFGMKHMPDTVIDVGRSGSNISKERQFDSDVVMRNIVYVQSAAVEAKRSSGLRNGLKIKVNLDPSRRFPGFPRRAQATPHV